MKKRTSRQGVHFAGKIKTEHAIVEGLLEPLMLLARHECIKSIIPGRIMRRGASTSRALIQLTIPTATGWKAVGKCRGATQDLFIVTPDPDKVKALLEQPPARS